MNRVSFWLLDKRFKRLAPHLLCDTQGKPRDHDPRVISWIGHVLKSGERRIDAPSEYGPRKTLSSRDARWAAKAVWERFFDALSPVAGAHALIDSFRREGPLFCFGDKKGEKADACP